MRYLDAASTLYSDFVSEFRLVFIGEWTLTLAVAVAESFH